MKTFPNRGNPLKSFSSTLALVILLAIASTGCADERDIKVGSSTDDSPVGEASKIHATNHVPEPQENRNVPSKANPRLRTIKLFLGAETLKTELALTQVEIQTGMMHRESMNEDEGMLFVFSIPHQASFWMKNVSVPLSCAYINPEGKIEELHNMNPHDETPIPSSSHRIQFVLEVRQGWFERHGIGPGTFVTTEHGDLQTTFFGNGVSKNR